MSNEIIKDVEGFEGIYKVSSEGYVMSNKLNRPMKPQLQNAGYYMIQLKHKGVRRADTIHRLVAKAFCPNPESKLLVNHKDGNKLNNKADNLEWVTAGENMRHAFDLGLMDKARESKVKNGIALGKKYGGKYIEKVLLRNEQNKRPVLQVDKNGSIIQRFDSIKAARRAGFHNVKKVLDGKYKQTGGFVFKLATN